MNNDIDLLPLEELAIRFGAIKRVYENSPGIDRIEFTHEQFHEFVKNVQTRERLNICSEITREDDSYAESDYMMDSNDCIKVILGEMK